MSILFDEIIFGPVRSRRLGLSLGVNILPEHSKVCSFNCVYCECGWTPSSETSKVTFHSRADIRAALDDRCRALAAQGVIPDSLTFAGNGEPTLHPDFAGIIDDTLAIRDQYFPDALVTVLSNSTTLHRPEVFDSLRKVNNIMKLDAGTEACFRLINKPLGDVSLAKTVEYLAAFDGKVTIQTLFMKARVQGEWIDNTSPEEVDAWLHQLERIRPALVMIYPIDRPAPDNDITKVSTEVLQGIAARVEAIGIPVKVYA